MRTAITNDGPLRLGFYLQRENVTHRDGRSLPYRGLDRNPWVMSPELDQFFEARGHGQLLRLWDEYLDAKWDGTLCADRGLAHRMRRDFVAKKLALEPVVADLVADAPARLYAESLTQMFEVVYAEVLAVPDDLDQHGDWPQVMASTLEWGLPIQAQLGKRPDGLRFLGCELCYPKPPFHSAIYQPGLIARVPDLLNYLNEHGLFPDVDASAAMMPEANLVQSGWRPSCVVGVWVDEK